MTNCDSVTKGGTHKLPKAFKIVETDMTIHWKALEEHVLIVPIVFLSSHFWGTNAFSEFFQKTSVLKS
jgi:hypothetical protein